MTSACTTSQGHGVPDRQTVSPGPCAARGWRHFRLCVLARRPRPDRPADRPGRRAAAPDGQAPERRRADAAGLRTGRRARLRSCGVRGQGPGRAHGLAPPAAHPARPRNVGVRSFVRPAPIRGSLSARGGVGASAAGPGRLSHGCRPPLRAREWRRGVQAASVRCRPFGRSGEPLARAGAVAPDVFPLLERWLHGRDAAVSFANYHQPTGLRREAPSG